MIEVIRPQQSWEDCDHTFPATPTAHQIWSEGSNLDKMHRWLSATNKKTITINSRSEFKNNMSYIINALLFPCLHHLHLTKHAYWRWLQIYTKLIWQHAVLNLFSIFYAHSSAFNCIWTHYHKQLVKRLSKLH